MGTLEDKWALVLYRVQASSAWPLTSLLSLALKHFPGTNKVSGPNVSLTDLSPHFIQGRSDRL